MKSKIPRVIASRSVERVLKLAINLLDVVPDYVTPELQPEWKDRRDMCIDDLDAILEKSEFVDS